MTCTGQAFTAKMVIRELLMCIYKFCLSQCRCIPQYCHGGGYCWWCNVTGMGTGWGWGAGGAGGRGGGATGNDSLDVRLASFWFRVTWLFSCSRFLAYTGSENVKTIKTLRIVHIHGVKISKIRPPWHVLLYYFTTRAFIKNPFDIFWPSGQRW